MFVYLILVFFVVFIPNLSAQEESLSAVDILKIMRQELKLNDEQVKQITPIIKDEIKQITDLQARNLDRAVMKTKMSSLLKETQSQLSNYLTQEQLSRWNSEDPLFVEKKDDKKALPKESIQKSVNAPTPSVDTESVLTADGVLESGKSSGASADKSSVLVK